MNAILSSVRRRRGASGFTLVELLTTLAVAGVLMVGAAPSLTTMMTTQGVKSTSFELVAALNYTRSEAIKRNRRITLRPDSDDWRRGWFLCSVPDPATPSLVRGRCASGEVELNLREWTHPNDLSITAATTTVRTTASGISGSTTTTTTTTPVTAVTYRSDGRATGPVQFTICNATPSAVVTQRHVRLDASGRPNLRRGNPCGT